jgi:hypothetical protein
MSRAATLVALIAALATGAVGLRFATRAVGGSDSSCYGLMAKALAAGTLQPRSALAADAPWPQASLTLAPAGFIPSPLTPGAASPVCAPGFALLGAVLIRLGGTEAFFWLSPLAGVLLVWLAFLLARSLAGPVCGATAALLTASMPVLLFQLMQPMNDLTAAACWLGGVAAIVVPARPRPWLAGGLTGLALLIRPNLLPAGVVLGLMVVAQHGIGMAARFAAGVVPGGVAVLGFNAVLYGGALQSGYGSAGTLFSVENVPPNLARYGRTLIETHFAWPLAGLFAPIGVTVSQRPSTWLVLISALAVVACYLPYASFPEWWYLRFLLPAIVPLGALGCVSFAALQQRLGMRWKAAIAFVVASLLAFAQIQVARQRLAFDLRALEARFRLTGEVIRDRLPQSAVAISVWDSGSISYHGGREVVLWDALEPAWLDRAVDWLAHDHREPLVVVERWEEPRFRERFAGQGFGALDWPPRFDVDGRVRVFVTADRAHYLRGEPLATETVWSR